ncbi:MAG: hypothetical protein Q8876_10395 [Bacillota bacterium]|nr:hypothetical protein [Bacillota bacterium]
MWNILIVILIAIIIWAFNPLLHFGTGPTDNGVDKKTMQNVQQVEKQAIQQVNQARQAQEQGMKEVNGDSDKQDPPRAQAQ